MSSSIPDYGLIKGTSVTNKLPSSYLFLCCHTSYYSSSLRPFFMPSSRHARGHKGNIAPPSSRMLKPSEPNSFENNTPSVSLALEGTKRWQRQDKDPDSPKKKRNDWRLLTGTWHGRKIWMSQRRDVTLSQRYICLVKVRERQRYCYVTSARAAELDGAGWLGKDKDVHWVDTAVSLQSQFREAERIFHNILLYVVLFSFFFFF